MEATGLKVKRGKMSTQSQRDFFPSLYSNYRGTVHNQVKRFSIYKDRQDIESLANEVWAEMYKSMQEMGLHNFDISSKKTTTWVVLYTKYFVMNYNRSKEGKSEIFNNTLACDELFTDFEEDTVPSPFDEAIEKERLDKLENCGILNAMVNGYSVIEIAEHLGLSRQSIYNRLEKEIEDIKE